MDKIGCEVVCKSHSARSERDHYRICPTKLSKSELENVYFALLENNLQLKKTINVQQDRIKLLSTKVQRMTSAQNVLRAEENKNCCVATKVVVNQQKDMIAELKRGNERLADRVRKLNMRLCSAKQFCKSANPQGLRCSTATSPYLIKHSPCSYKQQSHSTLKLAVSCQNLSRDTMVTKYVQTEPCQLAESEDESKPCQDNKCKTLIEELKEKNMELQELLTQWREASEAELQRSRVQRAAADRDLQTAHTSNALLTSSLRTAEGLTCELKMQLSIEKRRVAELETRLRAATMSNKVTKNIEDTLNSIQESNKASVAEVTLTCSCCSPRSKLESTSQQTYTGLSPNHAYNETKLSKSTEDSGYVDNKSQVYLDDQSLNKIIEDLTKRILVLQTQVDALTIAPPGTDNLETNVDSSDIEEPNTSIAAKNSKPKTNSKPQTTIRQNDEQIQFTNEENNGEEKKEKKNTTDPISFKESSRSGRWERNITKLKVFTDKIKDNSNLINEVTERTKINEESDQNNKENEEDIKSNKGSDRLTPENTEIAKVNSNNTTNNKSTKELPSTPEGDKGYNFSENYKPDTEKPKSKTRDPLKKEDKININKKISSHKKDERRNGIDSPRRLSKNNGTIRKDKLEHQNTITKMDLNIEKELRREKMKALGRTDTDDAASSCEEATYTVECGSGPSSSDDTDYEISFMTDLSEERELKSPLKSLSPGERKHSATHSDSCGTLNYSLSDGEIHVASVKRRSYDEGPKTDFGIMTSAPKMEETLQVINEELVRCKRLLYSQRSQENAKSAHV